MSDDAWNSDEETVSLMSTNLNDLKKYASSNNPTAVTGGGFRASYGNSSSRETGNSYERRNESGSSRPAFSWGQSEQTDNRRGGGGGGAGGTCYNCQGTGHMSRECPEPRKEREPRKPMTCYKCHEEGHTSRDCPQNSNSQNGGDNAGNSGFSWGQNEQSDNRRGGGGGGGGTCYNCQGTGHMSRECPEPRKEREPRKPLTCYKCHEEGHTSRDCPQNSNSQNGGDNAGNSGFSWGQNDQSDNRRGGGGGGGGGGSGTCYNCQGTGHMSRDCPEPRKEREPRKPMTCFKCQGEGHSSRDCPEQSDSNQQRSNSCFKCKESDHMARDCTKTDEELKSMGIEVKPAPVTYVPDELDGESLFEQGVSVGLNFTAQSNIPVNVSGEDVPPAIKSFSQSGLRSMLLENVRKAHYLDPTPIQKTAIPIIMGGRDIMACAQTGSGKTAAYLLPILHYILENNIESHAFEEPMTTTALILAPTRELGIQIYNEARKFAVGSILKICIVYGGVSVSHQHTQFKAGCHVLVATPGRLMDFVDKGRISFGSLKFLVLDEADRMLDMGFSQDVKKIVEHDSSPDKDSRHTLMFSATFSKEIQDMARAYLNKYIFVVIGIVGAANADVKQVVKLVEAKNKRETLLEFLKDAIQKNPKEKILVFVSTKRMADFLAAYFSQTDILTTSIHGDRYQNQREEALREFKTGIRNVLIATAVAARGLDIKGVGYVINHDMPTEIDEYVHRIGRTGRVGNQGNAISYFCPETDSAIADDLIRILSDSENEVPEWLMEYGGSGGGYSQGRGGGRFGASDIRKGFQLVSHESATAFGGPTKVEEEEEWD